MLELKREADPHSKTIYRDNKSIGFLQWHPNRDPHVILWPNCNSLTIKEMEYLIDQFELIKNPKMIVGQ